MKPNRSLPSPEVKRFMTVEDFAKVMNTTLTCVYRWIQDKKLRARYVIPEDEIVRWTENDESRQIKKILDIENQCIELMRFEEPPPPLNPLPLSTPDVEFLHGEIQRKVSYLESENRRLIDQNLRMRSVIRDELLLWQSILRDGKQMRYGEAKRHISRLLASTEYDGRDEAPMDYKERELGGDLRKEFQRVGQPPIEEEGKQTNVTDSGGTASILPDAGPERGVKPDRWCVEQIIGEGRKQN
jgi:excisionase family DNA binding protein